MLHFAVLGSGSSGNSALVCLGDTRILVDAGLSARQLCLRLGELGVDADGLSGIVLTHEHGDHTRGLEVFCRKRQIPVYATTLTAAIVRENVPGLAWRQFDAGASFEVGGIAVDSFSVPHDAVDPVGFRFEGGDSRLGLLSDVGHVTRAILDRLRGVDTLFTEANYDDVLLQNDTKRPWSTKQRISNRHGHLSNEQTAELVAGIAGPTLNRVILGHLSGDCNTPELALATVEKRLRAEGYAEVAVECAPRTASLPLRACARAASPATRYDEDFGAKPLRVCEAPAAAPALPSPALPSATEWSQTEWAF